MSDCPRLENESIRSVGHQLQPTLLRSRLSDLRRCARIFSGVFSAAGSCVSRCTRRDLCHRWLPLDVEPQRFALEPLDSVAELSRTLEVQVLRGFQHLATHSRDPIAQLVWRN